MHDFLFRFLELFHPIAQAHKSKIVAAAECRTVKENETLLREGQHVNELFFICKGVLKIVRTSENGNDIIHYFLKQNQFCTILKSFNENTVSTESIQAACDAELIVFKKSDLQELYTSIPYLKQLMDNIIHQGLLDKIATRNAYLGEDATTRYQTFLIRQPDIALQVSQTDIAAYLGVSKQSLSRIRRNLR